MSFIKYNNVKLDLNGQSIYANDVSLSFSSNLTPVYLSDDRSAFTFKGSQDSASSISVSYYLTGADPLKNHISDDPTTGIGGNFCGLTFESGYLSSYAINVNQFSKIEVNADIDIYGDLAGEFVKQQRTETGLRFLDSSDCTIGHTGISPEDNLKSFSYKYSSSFASKYVAGKIKPVEIRALQKKVSAEISHYHTGSNIPYSGEEASVNLVLNDKDGNEIDNYLLHGKVTSKSMSTSAGGLIESQSSVTQNLINDTPSFSGNGFDTSETFKPGDTIKVTGFNFNNITRINFLEIEAETFTKNDSTNNSLTITIPPKAIQCPIEIRTYGGKVVSSNPVKITQTL